MRGHARLISWVAPALDGNIGKMAQLAREVLDMNAGAAINVGRIFAGQQRDLVLHQQPSWSARLMKSVAWMSASSSGRMSAPPPGPFSRGRSTNAARRPAAWA